MRAIIEHRGAGLRCYRPEDQAATELRLDEADLRERLEDWARRYARAAATQDDAELLEIGCELHAWLDASGWATDWLRAAGARRLELRVEDGADPLACALLDAPWELLAGSNGRHLVADTVQTFEVLRRVGPATEPATALHRDLRLMFMAASPVGETVLRYEDEEASLLQATARLPLQLVVEESGTAERLSERLAQEGPFQVLHLSCHGGHDPERGPVLALEDDYGQTQLVGAGQLMRALGDAGRPAVLFLSACRSADRADGGDAAVGTLVQELVRGGVPAVLGWDGKVYDPDASAIAAVFYRELANGASLVHAAAMARLDLFQRHAQDPQTGHHWHMARVWAGPGGGGPVIDRRSRLRRAAPPADAPRRFLDKARQNVPVAEPGHFVGRRRELQAVLRAFNEGRSVLLHGMGNLGKSSLAARIADRRTRLNPVVVFRNYDALSILDLIIQSLPAGARNTANRSWRQAVADRDAALADALEALLMDALVDAPILLIVDDLERILETPTSRQPLIPVQPASRAALAAVLTAFDRCAQSVDSRLLLTSRYRFSLPDPAGGADLAAALACVPLRPLDSDERDKQWRAAARHLPPEQVQALDAGLRERILSAAAGNPGLQALLLTPLLRGETATAERAVTAIEDFLRTGTAPAAAQARGDADNALLDFFRRMTFQTYREALSVAQQRMLQAACLFVEGLPIPRTALEAAGRELGLRDARACLDRLLDLGLVDDWGLAFDFDSPHAAVNPLARPLARDRLDLALKPELAAGAVVRALVGAWASPAAGLWPNDARLAELHRWLLLDPAPEPGWLDEVGWRQIDRLDRKLHRTADTFAVAEATIARLHDMHQSPSAMLLFCGSEVAKRLGQTQRHRDWLAELTAHPQADPFEAAATLVARADRAAVDGHSETAMELLGEASAAFHALGLELEWAVTQGQVADILTTHGQFGEALRIHREVVLPVFERLGTAREAAVTQGKIADILQACGLLDEALRIRLEVELPVFEHMGAVRESAITHGKIADIFQDRGQLDEALRIRREIQLPVFERLGDVREAAVTHLKIGDLLALQGAPREAFEPLWCEALARFEQIGLMREAQLTRKRLAGIESSRDVPEQTGR